jgi:hypothetical protein
LHGSIFEFIRNTRLNANRWVPGGSNLTKDPLHRNQFGATAGGPIFKNKTFFFGSYSGLRERTTIFKNDATPLNQAERNGDLSASGGTAPTDPLNNNIAFPNRQIPVNRIDPVVQTIMNKYLPLPNVPGSNRYEVQESHPRDTDEILAKVDHSIGQAHRVTASLFYSTGADTTGLIGNVLWVDRRFQWSQYNYNAKETWIVSPNKINEFRAAYVRNFGGRVDLPQISLGDLGSKFQIQGTPSLAQIQVSGRFNMNSALAGPLAGSNQYQARDIFSISTSRHNVRIGGEIVLEKMIHDALLTNYGDFRFSTTNPRGTKNAVADWLLGFPATMAQDAPTTKVDNSWYYGLFIQDDFRVHPRLTLNLGARWDIQPPITDPHDRFDTFVPGKQSVIVKSAPAGLLFPGDPGVKRGIIGTDWNNVSPRLGVSWDPFGDRKTAIRAAAGIMYGSISGNEWNTSSDNQPFAIRQTFDNVYSISDPYRLLPGGVSPFPYSYSPANPRFAPPSGVVAISLGYKSPYAYQMNFAIQRQIARDASITVAYVTTLTHRIPAGPDQNYPVLTGAATTGNVNSRRPYLPGVLSTVQLYSSILNSSYHGLQITADKRFSHNFQVKGYYTFGKSLDYVNTQNSTIQAATDWNNIALDRGRTNNDRRHNAVFSGIWQLNYFNKMPVVARTILGGWSLSAIASFRSGAPLTVTSGVDSNFDGNTNDRADLIGNPFLDPNRSRSEVAAQWFNIAAFSKTTQLIHSYDGTAGRNILDGPGLRNVDLGIFREFRVTESKKVQFRAEATNALNMVNLSSPGVNANSPSTFGIITTAGPMRQVQLGLRLTY